MAVTTKNNSSASLFLKSKDWFKPHRSEAAIRISNSGIGILSIVVFTNLLPLPSPLAAVRVVSSTSTDRSWWWYICFTELTVMGALALNMLQAVYAIKYPRAPLPPLASPARPKGISSPPAVTKRRFKALSANASPQQQKSFSAYTSSPISTPSRVLNYTIPPPSSSSPFNQSTSSSISLPPTPSPILTAYRGKHSTPVGHPINSTTLSRLIMDSDSDDDDD